MQTQLALPTHMTPPPNGRSRWTPERDDLVRQMSARGAPADEIASTIGVSKAAAWTRMSRLGARTALDWAQKERIVELHGAGWRVSRIAKQIGIPEGDVTRHLHFSGLKVVEGADLREVRRGPVGKQPGCRVWSVEDDRCVREMTEAGSKALDIAQVLGRSANAVNMRRGVLGVSVRRGRRAGTQASETKLVTTMPAIVEGEPKRQVLPAAPLVEPVFVAPAAEIVAPVADSVASAAPSPLGVSLAAEINATEARIAELQETLGMMRALAGRLAVAA